MENKKTRNFRGSLLIAVFLVLLIIFGASLSIAYRMTMDANIVTKTRQGHAAYQNADTQVEEMLNIMKGLDNNSLAEKGVIPENVLAVDGDFLGCQVGSDAKDRDRYCTAVDDEGETVDLSSDARVEDVAYIQAEGMEGGATRKVEVPVPNRVVNDISNFEVEKCGTGEDDCTYNKCDVQARWEISDLEDVSGFEIRRSLNNKLSLLWKESTLEYGWRRAYGHGQTEEPLYDTDQRNFVIKNGDEFLEDEGGMDTDGDGRIEDGQYGQRYYFTIKTKNKYNYALDSLYFYHERDSGNKISKATVKLDKDPDCTDDAENPEVLDNLGCIPDEERPPGTETKKGEYNCCNGTECYQPKFGWDPDSEQDCALQQCGFDLDGIEDDALNSPNGSLSSKTGWCKTSVACVDGTDCDTPYRKVGYCSSCDTSVYPKWQPNNETDINLNEGTGEVDKQDRCCYEECRTDLETLAYKTCDPNPLNGTFTNKSFCAVNTCGPATYTLRCELYCADSFSAVSVKTGYPLGSCCAKACPTTEYYGTDCHLVPLANGYWRNDSTCSPNCTKPEGYDLKEICTAVCNDGYEWNGSACVQTVFHCARCSTSTPCLWVDFYSYSSGCETPAAGYPRVDTCNASCTALAPGGVCPACP